MPHWCPVSGARGQGQRTERRAHVSPHTPPVIIPTPVTLIGLSPRVTLATLAALDTGAICACDVHVVGAESWTRVAGGYAHDRFLNVDHHAPVPEMARRISSANLALERVGAVGHAEGLVVINHTDCDSILSAGIMSGRLEPRPDYGRAALAADHTGAPDAIADLLQSLNDCRDMELSYDSLARLERGQQLSREARERLESRLRARDDAARAVADGRIQMHDGLAVGRLDAALDGELLPPLLPDATLVVLFSPWPDEPGRWEVKVRLGLAAPDGTTLDAVPWGAIDPVQLGRWNARSNTRGGGTLVPPDRYLAEILRLLPASFSRAR